MTLSRTEIPEQDRWNVEALYPSFEMWKKAFNEAGGNGDHPLWPELQAYKGKLGESPATLKAALECSFSLDRSLTKLYTYAHQRHDEDITNDQYKVAFNQIMALLHEFAQVSAWFEPELLDLPEKTIQNYLTSPELAPYRFHIEKIFRLKKHTLSHDKEELLALAGKALHTSYKAFSAINDADFKFGTIEDSKGQKKELTHASYGMYVREQDRTLRQNAYLSLHRKFGEYQNTLCELINGQVQSHVFNAKVRNYASALEASLYPKNIDIDVYHALIKSVQDNLDPLHKYMHLREKVLGIGKLHLYDMSVPLLSEVDIKMSYKEAEEAVIESVAPLGAEYQNILRKGLLSERWVDRYENKNKRSGAYSGGCYDSMPYILMNYKGILRDVYTLAHEAGHSMHSYLCHKNQPYQYGNYPIFLAEVASTFNEELLLRLLLQRAKSATEKAYLINQKIDDIRATLFRQTMLAEFELYIHDCVEKNIPLTPKLLNEQYRTLNKKYFGETIVLDPESDIEWSRIPHFYYNFYVYQYSTGISAALALVEKVLSGGKADQEAYLNYLKGGSSQYPIEMLQIAGVDMRTPQPVKAAIGTFKRLVDELEQILIPEGKKGSAESILAIKSKKC